MILIGGGGVENNTAIPKTVNILQVGEGLYVGVLISPRAVRTERQGLRGGNACLQLDTFHTSSAADTKMLAAPDPAA